MISINQISKKLYNLVGRIVPVAFRISFSQEAEDLILRKIFEGKKNGFYVDVGAHHPFRFSNTYYFYRVGWSGINIDPMPGSKKMFLRVRPRDINLELGVSEVRSVLTYYQFNEPALNTFSSSEALKKSNHNYKVISKEDIQVYRLEEILRQHLPSDKKIDFMTIDVEGLDEAVVRSNNWEKYRPKFLVLEILGESLSSIKNNSTYKYVCGQGYELEHKTNNTYFFKDVK